MRLITLSIMFLSLASCFAQDAIIFRDGREKAVKIVSVTSDKTIFVEIGKKAFGLKKSNSKDAVEESVSNTEIFMLKFQTRGNVVFNEKGERVSSTSSVVKLPKDAIIVYYKDGKEVAGYNLNTTEHVVSFTLDKKGKGQTVFAAKDEVFMIKYPGGTRDVLADLSVKPAEPGPQQPAAAEQPKASRDSMAAEEAEEEPEDAGPSIDNPVKATIVTKKGSRMKVWICGDDGNIVSYKKTNEPKASIFRMGKSRIRNIQY